MNDLPDDFEELMKMLSKKRSSERDKNRIKEIDDLTKSFREMRSKNNSLKRKGFIEKIFLYLYKH
jgi:hypothetical protein